MLKFTRTLGLVLLLSACSPPPSQAAEPQQPRRQVSVSGEARRLVSPDQARLEIGVEGRASDSQAALDSAGQAAASVTAALTALMDANNVQATQTQLRRVVKGTSQGWVRDRSEPTEMLATRQITAERIPVEKLPELMRQLAKQPLAQIQQVQLSVSNAREIEDELLLAAIDDAKARAERIAGRLGVGLGLPITVSTQPAQAPQPKMMMRSMAASMESDAGGGFEATGRQSIEARVDISFELEAR